MNPKPPNPHAQSQPKSLEILPLRGSDSPNSPSASRTPYPPLPATLDGNQIASSALTTRGLNRGTHHSISTAITGREGEKNNLVVRRRHAPTADTRRRDCRRRRWPHSLAAPRLPAEATGRETEAVRVGLPKTRGLSGPGPLGPCDTKPGRSSRHGVSPLWLP